MLSTNQAYPACSAGSPSSFPVRSWVPAVGSLFTGAKVLMGATVSSWAERITWANTMVPEKKNKFYEFSDPPGPTTHCKVILFCFSAVACYNFPDGLTPCVKLMTPYWPGPGGSRNLHHSTNFKVLP